MEDNGLACSSEKQKVHEEENMRRGPWTVEEDLILINYISLHGDGRWNSLAKSAGLQRSGKSCRLRWLNYLRPDVRRGNITPEEQLLILDLHSRWGNRWSKIAQQLPGRTDNEIKNYWRTKIQKYAKQLNCDIESRKFREAIRFLWMCRFPETIRGTAAVSPAVVGGKVPKNSGGSSVASSSSSSSFSMDSAVARSGFFLPPEPALVGGGWPELPGVDGYGQGSWDLEGMMGNMWNVEDIWFF